MALFVKSLVDNFKPITSSLATLVSTRPTRSIQSWVRVTCHLSRLMLKGRFRLSGTSTLMNTRTTFQPLHRRNRVGSKFGGGGVAGASETNVDRRERLRKLALETIDLAKVCIGLGLLR